LVAEEDETEENGIGEGADSYLNGNSLSSNSIRNNNMLEIKNVTNSSPILLMSDLSSNTQSSISSFVNGDYLSNELRQKIGITQNISNKSKKSMSNMHQI
jgi:hypothetical protein